MALWFTPSMTGPGTCFLRLPPPGTYSWASHLRQDLVSFYGEQYRRYQTQVPMIVPGLKLPSSDDKAKSAEQA